MTIRVIHDPAGVEFRVDDVFARVDTRQHELRLENHRGDKMVLGALRASLLTSMAFVSDTFGIATAGQDFTPVPKAVTKSLVRRATERQLYDPSLSAQIEEMVPTPLLFSAPFLEARYVWADAFRFRACRVAIAHIEDDFLDADGTDTARDIVGRLERWRDLFTPSGKAARAVNTALQQFGESMPAEALWGLRKVTLHRPRTEQAPLEVLGWMAAAGHLVGGEAELARLLELVEAASDAEMKALLGERRPRDAALFLLEGDPESTTLLQLARSAAERLKEQHAAATPTAARDAFPPPPVPLPDVDGIQWVATVDELRAESARMHHCVQGLAKACLRGDSYIFHVEKEGTKGTVHVTRNGRVVEYRGPFNRDSVAATWGASVLRGWGAGMWIHEFEPAALAWPVGLPAPPGTKPLRSVRSIHDAYRALVARAPNGASWLAEWFRTTTTQAVLGQVGIYLRDDRPDRAFVLSRAGVEIADSTSSLTHEAFRRVYVVRGAHAVQDGAVFPMPPVPPPLRMDLRLVENERVLRAEAFATDAERDRAVRAATAGERFFLRHESEPEPGVGRTVIVLVEVDREGAIQGTTSRNGDARARARAEATVRKWSNGFWAARIGFERNTWHGERRVPHGGEPLRTVEACLLTYRQICEYIPDDDGRLARFFATHVEEAANGRAWIVVRDRSEGLVTVLDRRGNVAARTEDVLTRA